MRILQVNKYGFRKGGADIYALDLAERLETRGHNVALFARGIEDLTASIIKYDLEMINYWDKSNLATKVRHGMDVVWSRSIARAFDEVIATFEPDVIHFHSIAHQLSHSIVYAARHRNIPTVMTCHDYKLLCPSYTATRKDMLQCFDCSLNRVPTGVIKHQCLHDKLTWSLTAAIESTAIRSIDSALPEVLIAPSRFMEKQLNSSWLSTKCQVTRVENPCRAPTLEWTGPREDEAYILYAGRLSEEKGVDTAISAASRAQVKLVIAGDGPAMGSLQHLASSEGVMADFLGKIDRPQLDQIAARSSAQVIPSRWPENAPLVAIDSGAIGVPLVVSDIGGMGEIVDALGFGWRVAPDDIAAFAAAFVEATAGTLPASSPDPFREARSWDRHVDQIENVYSDGCRRHQPANC